MITLLVVVLGWVLFRSENLGSAWIMIKAMFGKVPDGNVSFIGATAWNYIPFYVIALVLCFPWENLMSKRFRYGTAMTIARYISCVCIFAVSIVFVTAGTYNAFIYFNF